MVSLDAALKVSGRDPRQLPLLPDEENVGTPPEMPTFAKRYVYALVSRDMTEIHLPVYATRRDATEARTWRPDADTVRIERCRLLMCRR